MKGMWNETRDFKPDLRKDIHAVDDEYILNIGPQQHVMKASTMGFPLVSTLYNACTRKMK